MTLTANERFGLADAPDSLALVQSFLNTRAAGRAAPRPDLLADLDAANAWWRDAAERAGLAAEPLDDRDLAALVRLRSWLDAVAARDPSRAVAPPSVGTDLELLPDGTVGLRPHGSGWKQVASLLLSAVHDAQLRDTFRRLKVCRNERCGIAFFDRSKNNSGVWHNPSTCGNIANVRASRARKRAAAH